MATANDDVAGVVFQSPLDLPASLTPMRHEVAEAMVDAIAGADISLPGIVGEATTAARFAGRWTEYCGSAAVPVEGLRVYELGRMRELAAVEGCLRKASFGERDLVVAWMHGLYTDIGQRATDPGPIVDRRLPKGRFWLWEDGEEFVSMAANTEPAEGAVRIQAVYTPPNRRNQGYAASCVRALSRHLQDGGHRCILYTDLGNSTSNSLYRRIGYSAIAEALQYRFE